jgi:hypothetical protein
MSTLMGAAWMDLAADADLSAVLSALRDTDPREEPAGLHAWTVQTPAGMRVELFAMDGYEQLASLVANVMRATRSVPRALIALDHDEYGAEHLVLAFLDGRLRRVHHVFVYPRDEETGEPYVEAEPILVEVPPVDPPEESEDPGAVVDGPAARASLARLYGVPVERLEAAAIEAATAHEGLQIVGEPFDAWLTALGLPWVGESGDDGIRLRSIG